jgi:inhibitor of KinA
MKMVTASDSSLLVVFGNTISPEMQERVLGLFRALQTMQDARLRNLHPGYTSLLIDFDPMAMTHEELVTIVESLAGKPHTAMAESFALSEIPVCFDAEFASDLPDVAAHAGLSIDEVVRLYTSATYRVCFLGFTAGFAYLNGLPEALHIPRLATPRRMVAAGSVGIAGSQTGIYPTETPGGWRLIGRTPLRMFDPRGQPGTRLQPGECLRFTSIDRETFERLRLERP